MFGAYQAGAWKALADVLEPDLVVGASIGAVNGWAIAGGCPPGELIGEWLNLQGFERHRLRFPRRLHAGVVDSRAIRAHVEHLYSSFRPRTEFALVATELASLKPRIFQRDQVTADLLVASTAIVGIFDQVRVNGCLYSDGGLLCALPVWAAFELGATHIVAVNVLPCAPGIVPWLFVRTVRLFSSFRPSVPEQLPVVTIEPSQSLGSSRDTLYWTRENAARWVEQGARDAARASPQIKHFLQHCFERQ